MRCLGASTCQQGKFIVGRCSHQSSIISFLISALGYFGFGIYFIIERIEAEMPARGILGTWFRDQRCCIGYTVAFWLEWRHAWVGISLGGQSTENQRGKSPRQEEFSEQFHFHWVSTCPSTAVNEQSYLICNKRLRARWNQTNDPTNQRISSNLFLSLRAWRA